MRWSKCIILLLSISLTVACSKKQYFVADLNNSAIVRGDTLDRTNAQSFSNEDYIQFSSTKDIRVYFHFCLPEDGSFGNHQAIAFTNELLAAANKRWRQNDKMNLPLGNQTSQLDTKIRLTTSHGNQIPTITSHKFDPQNTFIKKGKKSNRYDRKQLSDLLIRKDSVINIFFLPFDVEELKSGRQQIETTGIALGNQIKIAGLYESGLPAASFAGILNHEIGHVLGLRHTWQSNDFCADTPRNSNCWNYSADEKCSSEVSNNLMDYNAYQTAITPCQIYRMHKYLSTPGSAQNKVINESKTKNIEINIEYFGNQIWDKPIQSAGNIIINDKATLTLANFIHLPQDSKITVKKGGTLVLYDAHLYTSSDGSWEGIVVEKGGKIYSDTYSKLQNVRIQNN